MISPGELKLPILTHTIFPLLRIQLFLDALLAFGVSGKPEALPRLVDV